MQKNMQRVIFLCPQCLENFEFDPVGENQLVQCLMCKIHDIAVRQKQTLTLQTFEQFELRCDQ